MAILKGIISKFNGSAGNLTFKQSGGETIVSEKVTQVNDAKSEPQVRQRMKWANVVRMYKVLRPYMKMAFGGSQNRRTDYNKFVSANTALAPVYLTKSEVSAGACVVAPYKITHGLLNSISVSGSGKTAVTSIAVGSLTINAETSVAAFSNAVVENNRSFNYGDQITFFLVFQTMNDVTNIPVADVDACCIVLDKNNNAKLLSVVDPRGFAVKNGFLAAKQDEDFGDHGMVWIHSRKDKGNSSTEISAQYLVCENSLLKSYQSEDAYDSAANSYGGVNNIYLSPSGPLSPNGTDSSEPSGGNSGGASSDSGSGSGGGGVDPGTGDLEP